jgi:transposase
MARGIAHDDQTKAAVLAALLLGQSVSEVARTYKLPKKTVQDWNRQRSTAGLCELDEPQKSADIGDLISTYLRELLTTLAHQALLFRDVGWLRKQNAADLAVLHGVMADKTFRILEAVESVQQQDATGAAVEVEHER